MYTRSLHKIWYDVTQINKMYALIYAKFSKNLSEMIVIFVSTLS